MPFKGPPGCCPGFQPRQVAPYSFTGRSRAFALGRGLHTPPPVGKRVRAAVEKFMQVTAVHLDFSTATRLGLHIRFLRGLQPQSSVTPLE